jgi:trans-L-3-hydroxyproline dehydratase
MYGAILTEPVTPDGDLGVLFTHNEGYSTMCGHGIIALTTVAFETGLMAATGATPTLRLDTPAGRVTARAEWEPHLRRVRAVTFENVPSYVVALDQTVEVPGLGAVRYDLAFGGAFYAYCEAEALGLRLTGEDFRALIEVGMRIKRAVMAARTIEHPFEADLGFLYGTILCGKPHSDGAHSRNVCVFAEGEVDRSPTGTGVSGRVAIEHARGRLREGESFIVESILGTRFTGRVARATTFGPHAAVIPEVSGSAWITGQHEFLIAPDDPLREGFILR